MDIKRNKVVLNAPQKMPDDPISHFARLQKNSFQEQGQKEAKRTKKITAVIKFFFSKNTLFLALFIVLIAFFVWMWAVFFKRGSDADFKKEFETNFLPKSASSDSQAQSSKAATQTNKTAVPTRSASPPLNNQATENKNIGNTSPPPEIKKNEKFESASLGFSLEYPEGVQIAEEKDAVTITKDSLSWKIKFYDNKKNKDFQDWFAERFDIKDIAKCVFAEGAIKAGTYESKKVSPSEGNKCEGDGNYALSNNKSKVIKIELGKETAENANKILVNFKFIE